MNAKRTLQKHIYMYIYIYVNLGMYMYVCIYIIILYIYIYIYIRTHTCIQTYEHMFADVNECNEDPPEGKTAWCDATAHKSCYNTWVQRPYVLSAYSHTCMHALIQVCVCRQMHLCTCRQMICVCLPSRVHAEPMSLMLSISVAVLQCHLGWRTLLRCNKTNHACLPVCA
jgi:hypothetical protein